MQKCRKILGYNLKAMRRELGLTQKELAKACKISYRLFQRLEKGEGNPTLNSLDQIATYFGWEIADLLRLKHIHLSSRLDEFIRGFSEEFKDAEFSVGLRDLNGMAVWANKTLIKTHELNTEKFPFSVREQLPKECGDLHRFECLSERVGIAQPYLNHFYNAQGERVYMRYFPTLIFEYHRKVPSLVSIYATAIDQSSEDIFYRFAGSLIRCLEGLEKRESKAN